MNYKRHHNKVIDRARNRVLEGYCEQHHVIPVCMGGTDDPDNLVRLTAREHFVIHQLLAKMHPKHSGLAQAAYMMTIESGTQKRVTNKRYKWLRERYSKARSTFMQGNKINKGRTPWNKGTPMTEEQKNKISKSKLGVTHTPEHRRKNSESQKGIPWTKERRSAQRMATCPHCDKNGMIGNMHRWHFDNCKELINERI